jgi:BirA family transcriptional regulator, biotin operon repressor / biotin---[acetyl-CoA-carboxylase] ligase
MGLTRTPIFPIFPESEKEFFLNGNMNLSEQTLKDKLAGKKIGSVVRYFREIGSTNTMAFRLALEGAEEGVIVVADTQTEGRGRLSRTWQSPPGCNVYVSMILRPQIAPAMAPQITLMAGVAVAELFSSCCPESVSIKWPNDVLIRGKKTCGILSEMKTAAGSVDFIILGIGLNINMNRDDFEPSLRDTATSLKMETGQPHDRLEVISKLLDLIEKWYKVFLRAGFIGLRDNWLGHADIIGRRIKVVFKDAFQIGVVVGIDDDGTILMRQENGVVKRVIAGDVHVLRG